MEKTVIVNHAASVLMAEELDLGADGRLELGEEGLNFTGGLLTVREFMKEQEEKNNGLLHGDSYNITVEGHIGTWYAIDETEVGGEKFFLLEHEEYGDEAACVAVNEQGKLVAEDLWNGFDEDFQDAVKEYFAEKNPTFQKEEQAVPVAEKSRADDSDVPVYYESFAYAAENGEVDLYRISRQLNEDCRNAIEEAIADNFDGMRLADDATKSVVEQFGMERMGYILAYTLNYNNHDGRYSHSNKEWADTTCKGERGNNICKKRVKESSADKTIYKYLVGKWYNAEKTRIHAKRKEERRKSLDLAIKKKGEEGQLVSIPVDRISKVIAVQISMSYNSVESYGMLAKFLDEIAEKDEAFFTALVENKIVVSFEKMRKLAQMDETKLIDIRRKLLREEDVKMRQRKPRQQSTDGLSGKTQQKQTTPLEVGIKEMPMFDPDMEFRGLALTIPTWMNAIARTRAKTDIDLVSEPTKAQLAVILRRLEEQITQTLEVIER